MSLSARTWMLGLLLLLAGACLGVGPVAAQSADPRSEDTPVSQTVPLPPRADASRPQALIGTVQPGVEAAAVEADTVDIEAGDIESEPAAAGEVLTESAAEPAPGAATAPLADDAAVSDVGAAGATDSTELAPTPAIVKPSSETPVAGAADLGLQAAHDDGEAALVGPPALIPEGDASSPHFIGPPLVPPLKLLGEEVPPGSKRRLRWSASQSFAGGDTVAPVNVVHGSRPGPVLCLAAAIHGDEINGVEIVRRLINQADPDRLSGTLVGVPIVNLFGFSRNSRYLPDRRDLNRYFPGSRRGSIASRIAFSFFEGVAQHCDALVDFHTGSFDRANLPQVRADLRIPDVLRFSRGFGELPVLHSNGSRGMLRVAATQAGIPAVTFEVGAPGTLEPMEIRTAVIAIDALMHSMGMTPDAPDEQAPQAIFYDSLWVRANAGGMLVSDVRLGERVIKGQRLGVVIDPIKNQERPILSPVFGRVIGQAKNQVVLPGFAAFHLGEETSAEEASDAATSGRIDESVEEDAGPDGDDADYREPP